MGDNLVNQLRRELDMDESTASRGNLYVLPFDGDVDVEIILNPKSYLFKTNVGKCPEKNLETFLLQISEVNLFGNAARGATLGYNELENHLTLSFELDYNCGYIVFKEKIEDFVSSAIFWKNKLLEMYS